MKYAILSPNTKCIEFYSLEFVPTYAQPMFIWIWELHYVILTLEQANVYEFTRGFNAFISGVSWLARFLLNQTIYVRENYLRVTLYLLDDNILYLNKLKMWCSIGGWNWVLASQIEPVDANIFLSSFLCWMQEIYCNDTKIQYKIRSLA